MKTMSDTDGALSPNASTKFEFSITCLQRSNKTAHTKTPVSETKLVVDATRNERSEISSTDPNATRMMERMFRTLNLRGGGPNRDYRNPPKKAAAAAAAKHERFKRRSGLQSFR